MTQSRMSDSDRNLAILMLVRQGGYEQMLRMALGDDFDSYMLYLAQATAGEEDGLAWLAESIARHPIRRTLVLTGQRGMQMDGHYNPVLNAMERVLQQLAPVSARGRHAQCRDTSVPNATYAIFSGGGHDTHNSGWYTGGEMVGLLNRKTRRKFVDLVQNECVSRNFGEQARMLAALALVRRVERVVFVHSRAHIARFAANICGALQMMINAENENLRHAQQLARGILDQGRETANVTKEMWVRLCEAMDVPFFKMPEVIFVACGNWEDTNSFHAGMTQTEDAFGSVRQPIEGEAPHVTWGGEYGPQGLIAEQTGILRYLRVCPAANPREMLELIRQSEHGR